MNATGEFRKALETVLAQYAVRVVEHDQYDSDEAYAGSDYTFEGRDATGELTVYLPVSDLAER
jgi:hypothetical protein